MRFAGGRSPPKWALNVTKFAWGVFSPFAVARKLSHCRMKKILTSYVRRHQPGQTEEENVAMENYLFQILLRKGTSEYALFRQFDFGLNAYKPLSGDDKLGGNVSFPVSIVFGDRDWMDSRGATKIILNNKFFKAGASNLYILKKSGHQMAIDQPIQLAKIIIEDVLGISKNIWQPNKPTVRYLDDQGNDLAEHPWDLYLTELRDQTMVWNTARETETYKNSELNTDQLEPRDANMYGDEIPSDDDVSPMQQEKLIS